ncbi:MAG: hypothetical protein D6794_00550, partial [Deltaproteobacteria bacterium]
VPGRNLQDGALPSGISAATDLLLRLGRLTGDTHLEQAAEGLLRRHSAEAQHYPRAYSWLLSALDRWLDPEPTLVLVPEPGTEVGRILRQLYTQTGKRPATLIATDRLRQLDLPALQQRKALDERTTFWYCAAGQCHPPTTDISQIEKYLLG